MGIIIWRIQLATVILARTAIQNLRKNIRKRTEKDQKTAEKRVKDCRRGQPFMTCRKRAEK